MGLTRRLRGAVVVALALLDYMSCRLSKLLL